MSDEKPTNAETKTSSLRMCRVVTTDDGERFAPFVHCPQTNAVVDALECAGCVRLKSVDWDPEVGGQLTCAASQPELTPPKTPDRRVDIAEAAARIKLFDVVEPITTCITPDLTIAFVKHLFREKGLRAAPVVDANGRLAGLISRTDVMRAADFGDVSEMMPPTVHALPADAPLAYAIALMAFENLSEVPVVTDDGRVVGIYYALDAMRWLAKQMGYVVTGTTNNAHAHDSR